MFRYLRQIGTNKATGKQNQGFAERFNQLEADFKLFGFTEEVHFNSLLMPYNYIAIPAGISPNMLYFGCYFEYW